MNLSRGSISYHMALDHYGVALGGGNMFEWAKDLGANDKDIVFVLDPEPLIAAGVDPQRWKDGFSKRLRPTRTAKRSRSTGSETL